jgi:hypothetical protein
MSGEAASSDGTDEGRQSRAIGSGIGIGAGIGAGWGLVMASMMDGDVATGITIGAGAGVVIALVSGTVVYRMATA